jgi:pimeloyl-ACP methyl ester carboxylesterase
MVTTQISQFTVQAGPITAQVAKAGQGDPLVYLHGAFGGGGWPPFLDALAERFSVYAPVQPGFGETEGIEHLDDILDLTLYHFDLLDALDVRSPIIVGHFFGAMVAAEMAALRPRIARKLVLISPAGLWLDDDPGVDVFATPATELRAVLFRDPKSAAAKKTMPELDDEEERAQQSLERARALSAVAKFLWPIPDKGLRKRLHRITAPTLVVMGSDDKLVPPPYGAEVTSRVPNSRVEVIQDSGHLPMLEQPEEVARVVSEFLSD